MNDPGLGSNISHAANHVEEEVEGQDEGHDDGTQDKEAYLKPRYATVAFRRYIAVSD